jgi:hypothetical protein
MSAKFAQSWQLFKASIAITFRHRKLLWFPVLTACLTAVIAFFFLAPLAVPLVFYPTGYRISQKEHWVALERHYFTPAARAPTVRGSHNLGTLLPGKFGWDGHGAQPDASGSALNSFYLAAIYFLSMFLATFFNVAFYNEIIAALNGQGVSFRRGLGVARSRLPAILAWSLMAGVVGWLIRRLEQRLPFIGSIIAGFIGLAWSVAAVFVIPVIVQQQTVRNPIKILKESALTLKRTWGESLIGYVGFSAGNLVIFACSLVPLLAVGAIAMMTKSIWLFFAAIAIWFVTLLLMSYIVNIASHVYRCALYMYAAEGAVPEPYSQELMDAAWRIKGN